MAWRWLKLKLSSKVVVMRVIIIRHILPPQVHKIFGKRNILAGKNSIFVNFVVGPKLLTFAEIGIT